MKPSKILAKMRAGKVANSIKLNLMDPRAVDLVGMLGFDSVWLCLEHIPNSIAQIENMVRAAKMHDMDSIVRVRKGCYSDYIYPLEMDATGIMIPHCMSLEEAKQIVKTTRFHPLGLRPWDGGNADGAYCMMPPMDYIEQANRERCVIVMIEDPEPLDELDAIAALEGIDMMFFGPYDFAQAIGKPAQVDAPDVIDTKKHIAEVCRNHGKYAGTLGSVDTYESLVAMGYQYIVLGVDVIMLADAISSITRKLEIGCAETT